MATTTNYGWETPDDTDLVKDGALAARTTGSAIDTTLWSVTGGKNVGMVHLNSTSFSAVSSISVNNVFSSSFENYVITVTGSASGDLDVAMRFRASGSDTSSGYQFVTQRLYAGPPVTTSNSGGTSQSSMGNTFGLGSSRPSSATINVFRPNTTDSYKTIFSSNSFNHTGVNILTASMSGTLASSTQFDGFTFLVGSGNITGNLKVYGLRNS